jgi:hypothetical protein
VLDALFEHLAWLHHFWRMYVALFGTVPDRFDVYNKRTPHIFGLLEKTLRECILLELAKLLGHHESAGHRVVSIERAIVDLPLGNEDQRTRELRGKAHELKKKHRTIIAYRDRSIAHNDLAVATKAVSLNGVSRAMMKEAVDDCVALLNEVLRTYNDSEYGFIDDGGEEDDVQVLLKILELGNEELDRQDTE